MPHMSLVVYKIEEIKDIEFDCAKNQGRIRYHLNKWKDFYDDEFIETMSKFNDMDEYVGE